MNDIKELAKWLEEEVEFLKNNQDYVGGWYDLGNGLGAVVLWEEGWGDEIRDDAIQATDNPDWALCAGIMLINKDDTPDGWFMPWDSKTGDIICETTGITPNEDYEKLAGWLLDDFNSVKDLEIKPNGEVIGFGDDENKGNPYDPEKLPDEGMSQEEIDNIEVEEDADSMSAIINAIKDALEDDYNVETSKNNLKVRTFDVDYDFKFNKDGSVDLTNINDIIDNQISWGYLEDTKEERDDFKKAFKHFDSAQDLVDSSLPIFLSVNIELPKKLKEEKKVIKEDKMIKEDKEYSTSPYKDVIAEYFDYSSSFEFLDVVASIIGRVDNFSDDEDIYQAIDDELIYTYDQWKVLEEYCTPQDANWEVAFESLCNDIFSICANIADAHKDADDEMLNDVEDED